MTTHEHTVRERGNVAKYRPDPKAGTAYTIPVIDCDIEVGELMTVESMGHAVPVLLCVADMSTGTVYYLCLNDYVSKVLLPNNPSYTEQQTVTVHVPAWNVLDPDDPGFTYIAQLARRAKLYSAFNSFVYQRVELSYAFEELPVAVASDTGKARFFPELVAMLDVFLTSAVRLDIWEPAAQGYWAPLADLGQRFAWLHEHLRDVADWNDEEVVRTYFDRLQVAGDQSITLGRMFEELVREWRLPTALRRSSTMLRRASTGRRSRASPDRGEMGHLRSSAAIRTPRRACSVACPYEQRHR